jgi:ABC-type branched-subunit amino acid transport system substrate-binding protein
MRRTLTLTLALVIGSAGCLQATPEPAGDGIPIGVLLPYTGQLGTVGQNLERAVILANEQLAAAEPDPARPPFRLVFRDTHSDNVMGLTAATELIEQERAAFILGPEENQVADSMADRLRDRTVAITGGVVSLDSVAGTKDWFRIVPTAQQMSSRLAAHIIADHINNLAVIYVPDKYGNSLSMLTADEFKRLGGHVSIMAPLTGDVSNSQLVHDVLNAQPHPDAILLLAYPTGGAAVIQEWAVLSSSERWYFGPSLRADAFILNVPPGLLDGMIGVSAGLSADAANFAKIFRQRWHGEEPSNNAHYYFDAMLLAGMAHRYAVAVKRGAAPTTAELAAALVAVSGPPGKSRTWQEVRAALTDVEMGTEIDYRGTSGPVDFSMDGSVPQGFVQGWTIMDGTIQYAQLKTPQ